MEFWGHRSRQIIPLGATKSYSGRRRGTQHPGTRLWLRTGEDDLIKTSFSAQDIAVGGCPAFVARNGKRYSDVILRMLELSELRPAKLHLARHPMGLINQLFAVDGEAEACNKRRTADG